MIIHTEFDQPFIAAHTSIVDRLILGESRIRKTVTQTELGKSRVQVIVDRTQLGKGDIRKTTTQTQLGKGSLTLTTNDDFESYSDGASLNGLNGGAGDWEGAYVDGISYLGVIASDDMESYSDAATVDSLNGGTGWNGAYVSR